MPTLADIYSTIDSAKRRGADVIRNPGASLQQMIGYGVDRANAARDQLYQATEEEGISYGPKTQQLAKQMAEVYNPIGMTTWHGSPHIFQKFDLSKLGTGEGAQVYGSGMYVAQNPKVAEDYAKNIMGPKATPENVALKVLNATGNEDTVSTRLKQLFPQINDAEIKSSIDTAKNYKGNVYKVDVPDTHIRRMLDWDAPIK
jgi:hypothetical protein